MNKKTRVLFILLVSVILVSGCSKTEKIEDNKNLTFTEWAEKNIEINNNIRKINCPEINENSIMSGSSEIFITDNNIYKYNVDKLFSNDKNCKLIGTIDGSKPMAVNRDNAIDETGTLYNIFWQRVKDENYDGNYEKDTLHDGWKEYLKRFNVNKQMISASDIYSYDEQRHIPNYEIITYTNDGLYLYNIDSTNYSSNDYPKGKEFRYKINTDDINDEKIIRLYGSIVKTNKAFYTLSSNLTNKEECNKYADVKCEYEYSLKKDETLTKYYDEILNITNEYFITKDYELISVGGYYYIS